MNNKSLPIVLTLAAGLMVLSYFGVSRLNASNQPELGSVANDSATQQPSSMPSSQESSTIVLGSADHESEQSDEFESNSPQPPDQPSDQSMDQTDTPTPEATEAPQAQSSLAATRPGHSPKQKTQPIAPKKSSKEIGTSREGRPIKLYQYGSGNGEQVIVLGSFHGDELPIAYIMQQVQSTLDKSPKLYADQTVYLIPIVNPDGLARGTRPNGAGVDLNRNFPTRNFIPGNKKGTRYYSGKSPLSEPESQAIQRTVDRIIQLGPVRILSIHAPLAMNNYDGAASESWAKLMSQYNGLPAKGEIGYPTPGSFGTYYGQERGIPLVTLETADQAGPAAWNSNGKAIMAFIQGH